MDDDATGKPARRTKHAERRAEEGRPTSPAFNDAQRAKRSQLFIDVESNAYVVSGKQGREQIFNARTGAHVTAFWRSRKQLLEHLESGRIRRVTDDEYMRFLELFK